MATILVCGDSWTDPNYKSMFDDTIDTNHPKWPEFIKFNNKGDKIINVGYSGNGNIEIVDSALDELYKDIKVDRVIIALSDWLRFKTPEFNIHVCEYLWFKDRDVKPTSVVMDQFVKMMDEYYKIFGWNPSVTMSMGINNTLRSIYNLYHICKSKNIKLHVFQMIKPVHFVIKKQEYNFSKVLKQNPLYSLLEKEANSDNEMFDLIGWPFNQYIGGSVCELDTRRSKEATIKRTYSEEDRHPNEAGHRAIAGWFNLNSKDNY